MGSGVFGSGCVVWGCERDRVRGERLFRGIVGKRLFEKVRR